MAAVRTAFVILPGEEDPAALMRRGGLEVRWKTGTAEVSEVRSFSGAKLREAKMPRVVDADLILPTLYLHFLATEFTVGSGQIDIALASGNHNSELNIALPARYMPGTLEDPSSSLGQHLTRVLAFLRSQGETLIEGAELKPGGFGPRTKYATKVDASRVYFNLKTARPKSSITLDKASFGIPTSSELYLFVNNHDSVAYMDEEERESFEVCIEELPQEGERMAKLAIFLKVFYEGGFAYNEKRVTSARSYLPINVGIACMSVVPAFEGQSGISTGYPCRVPSGFVPFADTVPVTIRAIREMSQRHHRYGLCFTRCAMVWEGEDFEQEGVLNYSIIAPHGGFFYIPGTLKEHRRLGGLVYAFGEARAELEAPESLQSTETTATGEHLASSAGPGPQEAAGRASEDRRVCTICLESDADTAAVPCGHRAYCSACAKSTPPPTSRPCPVCRASVKDVLKVY